MKSNIPPSIRAKIGKNLHKKTNHPLEIIKRKIYDYFGDTFEKFEDFSPIVRVEENFDKLLILKDHPARGLSDTYYESDDLVLRTHTSAHQNELLITGHKRFLVAGDVYRKDDLNATHSPCFHQLEGVCIVEDDQDPKVELKKILNGLINVLFPGCEYRFNADYFPFTEPSFEVEVMFNGSWLEVLGCGVVHKTIMENCGLKEKKAYAFGLGLERLAMLLFKIPDIRYFWSEDERFSKQFESGEIVAFNVYSAYPPIERDIAFWLTEKFHNNGFCEIARELGGDLIENVSVIDEFTHPKTQKTSKCFRIIYRSNERTLTNEEINKIQDNIRDSVVADFEVEIRK